MASGINGVLRGVQGDLKNAIIGLSLEGWTPSKTNGGHIRLDHPDAARPVFTASTPGDHRTPDNLRRDCRGALRSAQEVRSDAISEEEAITALRKHKATQKARKRRAGLMDQVGQRVADGIISDASAPKVTGSKPVVTTPRKRPAETPKKAPATTPKTETREMKMTPVITPSEGPVTPAKPAQEAKTRPPKVVPAPVSRAETAAPVPAAAPSPDATPRPVSEEIALGIRIGLRIASGELTRLEITPDMVGMTLITGPGETHWLDRPAAADAAPAPDWGAKKGRSRRNARFSDAILAFLGELSGEEVPISMIVEHMVEKGFYKARSARGGVARRLEQLAGDGLILYRTGPGEPCAKIAG